MGVNISEHSVDALTTVIELSGELDLYSAADVNARLSRAIADQCHRLVVDIREISSIDFSTIAILTHSGRALAAHHGVLEVLCRPGEVARLLAAAGESGAFRVSVSNG